MNAETLYRRQLDIVPLDRLQKAHVTVIGAGAVGSFTAFTLAKMGVGRITAYDDDEVTEHNLPNQLFRIEDIGKKKATALREIVESFHGVEIDARNDRYAYQPLSGIVIVAVDSMDVRIAIWKEVKYNPNIEIFIDSRMGAEVGRVIAINPCDPDDVTFYESTLHTSKDALQARCTEKTIIYTVLGIASAICGKVKKHLTGHPAHKSITLDFRQSILLQQ
jgi:tRNA A37 threonylcarbamoyladenosine dehydratase